MKKDSNTRASIAIARLAAAIQYLSWAQQAKTTKDKVEWRSEALNMIDFATKWINEDMPF